MDTVSWSGLVGNGLWICGLAICLAALSMAHYRARVRQERLGSRLRRPETQLALAIGLGLCCSGLLLCGSTWWEKGIWGLGVAISIVWIVRMWRRIGADRREDA